MKVTIDYRALAVCFLLIQFGTRAQYAVNDFDLEGEVGKWYDQAQGFDQAGFVLGEYHKLKRESLKSHPFFIESQWVPGRMFYRGNEYDSIYLIYDIHSDLVLMRYPGNDQYLNQVIKLIQDQVKWFRIAEHTFGYYPQAVLNIAPGFFDQLYIGQQFDVIVKRRKETRWEGAIDYIPTDSYMLRYNNNYIHYRRKRQIFELLNHHKREMKKFIADHKLKPKPGNDDDLILFVRFCDQLAAD